MDRKRGIWSDFLIVATFISAAATSCIDGDMSVRKDVCIRFSSGMPFTKAEMPDEEKISDVNLMIFDAHGLLEKHIYMDGGQRSCTVSLLKGETYSVYACANFGYEVKADRIEGTEQIDFHLAYPDEYREGIPMAGHINKFRADDNSVLDMELERLMARISLKMDRSRLTEGVKMDVISVRIGNCPKKTKVFTSGKATSEDDCFRVGFSHDDTECHPLNRQDMDGISDELSVYMLENMQGIFSDSPLADDYDKAFRENDPRESVCSYIEMELDYNNGEMASIEQPLIYRFYLGEDRNSLDIERNCHYHITVSPEDDGLHGDGWRVDKTGLAYIGEASLQQYPGDYIVGNIGEKIHIGCILTPPDAPFDIGLEYLEADRLTGIYDYEIDRDGHGVTLTLTGPGSGLIYMEAGDPINDAALFLIEVNLPD